jgi:hypothetical protein
MKGDPSTIKSTRFFIFSNIFLTWLVSGKMLRYNEERNLIGFKYNNRSIRIFPVFDEPSKEEKLQDSKKSK